MDISKIYAIIVAISFLVIFLWNNRQIVRLARWIALLWSRHLTYRYLLYRHHFIGPWSRAGVLIQLIYIITNVICIGVHFSDAGFQASTVSQAGFTAGTLSLVNAIPLLAGPFLSSLADFLSISIGHYKTLHRSAGIMCFSLALFHVIIILITKESFSITISSDMFALIVRVPEYSFLWLLTNNRVNLHWALSFYFVTYLFEGSHMNCSFVFIKG